MAGFRWFASVVLAIVLLNSRGAAYDEVAPVWGASSSPRASDSQSKPRPLALKRRNTHTPVPTPSSTLSLFFFLIQQRQCAPPVMLERVKNASRVRSSPLSCSSPPSVVVSFGVSNDVSNAVVAHPRQNFPPFFVFSVFLTLPQKDTNNGLKIKTRGKHC